MYPFFVPTGVLKTAVPYFQAVTCGLTKDGSVNTSITSVEGRLTSSLEGNKLAE